jgi:ABC-type nitrate/sulfonate/bicarbonate transport system permease component
MRSAVSLLVTCLLLVHAATLSAQQLPIRIGQRVRVTAPSLDVNNQEETFHHLRGETLVFESMWCPLAAVTQLDVYGGRRRETVAGALAGGVIGLFIGSVIGADRAAECESQGGWFCGMETPASAGGGLMVGALVGAVVGSLIKTNRWKEVQLDRMRVTPVVAPDGRFGLAASVRF